MIELMKLLDNGWDVLLFKQVDRRYCAAAKRKFKESWKDVFAMVNADDETPEQVLQRVNIEDQGEDAMRDFLFSGEFRQRMPHRVAGGETPDDALSKLVKQVVG